MSVIVTKGLVLDYVMENPGVTPKQISEDLGVSLCSVNKRLLKLLCNGRVDRKGEYHTMEHIFYFPVKR